MNTQLILIIILLIIISASFVLILLNIKFNNKKSQKTDFHSLTTQLIALTVWVIILTTIFLSHDAEKNDLNVTVFLVTLLLGIFLMRSLFEEARMQDTVYKLLNKLNEDNQKLRELDKKKTEFVSLASHQLRGPLSVINGYVSMILDKDFGDLPENMKEPIYRISRSSQALGFLINDYLDVTKIEKGEMEYLMQNFNIVDLLKEVTEEFKIIAEKEKLDFTLEINCSEKTKIKADKLKFKQILSNLLDNAIKYTKKGFVKVNCEINEKTLIIKIQDTGIGIPKNRLQDIFNKFSRDEQALKLNVVGTGLGLFVAKVMLEAQNGKIRAESEGLGKGSIFTIFYPLK